MVLIHAKPFDRRLWLYQTAHFSSFYKVISVDLRGYGYSDKPDSPTTISELAEEVIAVCEDAGVASAIVIGISVGGVIALQLGLDHPEFCRALVPVGCYYAAPPGLYKDRIAAYQQGVPAAHREHLQALVSPAFRETVIGRYLLGLFTDWDARLNPQTIISIYGALADRDVGERLSELKVPVLVVHGEHDNPSRGIEMSEKIALGAHHIVPGAGHACCLENPADFDAAVLTFLKRHGLGPSGRTGPD